MNNPSSSFQLLLSAYKNFGKYLIKIASLVFLFALVGCLIGLIADEYGMILNYDYFSLLAFEKMSDFSFAYGTIGILALILIVLSSILFIIPWWDKASIASFIRDLIIILFFGTFSMILFLENSYQDGHQAVSPANFDYFALSALFSIYFVMVMSNFGGVYERTGTVIKSLLYILAFSAIASLPLLIQKNFNLKAFYSYFIYASMIYLVSFVVKIMLHPEDIVTVNLTANTPGKTDLKRLAFSFLMLLAVVPFLGLGWTLLLLIIVFLIGLFFPLGFQTNTPFVALFSYLILPAGFILHLARHDILGLLVFIVAVARDVSLYVDKISEKADYERLEYKYLEGHFMYKLIRNFNFRAKEEFSKTFVVLSAIVFPVFCAVVFLSFMDHEKIFTKVKTISQGNISYDKTLDNFKYSHPDDTLLTDKLLMKRIKNVIMEHDNYFENLAENAYTFHNQFIDSLNHLKKIECLHRLPDSVLFLYTSENVLFTIDQKRGKIIDSIAIEHSESWPFICPGFTVSDDKNLVCFYTDRTFYLFGTNARFIRKAEAPGRFHILKVDARGTKIAIGNTKGNLAIFDTAAQLIFKARPFESKVSALGFSPDGTEILVGSVNSEAFLLKQGNEKPVRLKHSSFKSVIYALFKKSANDIDQVVYSNDGSLIMLRSDYLISLWDREGKLISKFNGHSGEIKEAVFSDDNKFIITSARDNQFIIRDLTGKLLYKIPVKSRFVSGYVFDEEKRMFITITQSKISIYGLN